MERAVRGARILITEVLGSRLAVRHCEIARPFLWLSAFYVDDYSKSSGVL
jgi:hypothetical protein